MPRYELSIKATYLPGWSVFEGIRELVQNAKDAEVQYDAPMEITYTKRRHKGKTTGAIVIVNKGAILPKEALLIGHTSKVGNSKLIGKFGEGLKFGILALLRNGVEIKIRNGSEVWVPYIAHSEKFNADVLFFNVSTGNKEENRVQFEILGVDPVDWDSVSERLLFIGEYPEGIKVPGGHVLTSPKYKGHIFVKGMFVAKTKTTFGYDFEEADIDRDRRMVNDLNDKTSYLLSGAVNEGQLASQVFFMMQEGLDEVSYLSNWRLNEAGRKAIAHEFTYSNPDVIPVERDEQVKELESYGKKAKQVPWTLRTVLEDVIGTAADALVSLRRSEKTRYEYEELTSVERDNFRLVVSMAGRACAKLGENVISISEVHIVDFHSDDRLGTYDPNTGCVRLARKILKNKGQALYVFVHEIAHAHGGDGVRSHEAAIGNIMTKVLEELL